MADFHLLPRRPILVPQRSPLTPPASERHSAASSGQFTKEIKPRIIESGAWQRKRSAPCSSNQYAKHEKQNDPPTVSSQTQKAARPNRSSYTVPPSRPRFTVYKTRPIGNVSIAAGSKTTDVPRSRRVERSSTYLPQFTADRYKETNPHRLALLWRKVMTSKRLPRNQAKDQPLYSSSTLSSRSKASRSTSSSRLREDPATSESLAPVSLSATILSSQRTKNATVQDANFEDTQLKPRGIRIQRTSDLNLGAAAGAFNYFQPDNRPQEADDSCQFYRDVIQKYLGKRVKRSIDDSIFVPMAGDFVDSVYLAYHSLVEAEAMEDEFRQCASELLLKRKYTQLANDPERQICAIRCLGRPLKPDALDNLPWQIPQILPTGDVPVKAFEFDITPDCQYWLSDKILNPDYREHIYQVVHCDKGWHTFSPYFSIEFKSSTKNTRTAQNQVAAAGSMSLYNRLLLKLHICPQPSTEQLRNVRHYGLTMENADWKVWLFEPKLSEWNWAGCEVRYLDGGSCKTTAGVRRLIPWINEIHRWGLCQYARDCERDIKGILLGINIRISDIGPEEL